MAERSDWPERRDEFRLRSDSLSLQEVVDAVKSPACGAVSVFIGTTREDELEGRKVIGLQYEAYESMAQSELCKLSRVIRERWPRVTHICVQHRLGWVAVGEASVAVAISAPHRRDSEEAVQFCVTRLKASVPIWKKEVFEDRGFRWNENAECSWSRKHTAPPAGGDAPDPITAPPAGGEAPDRSTAPPTGGEAPDRSTAPPTGGEAPDRSTAPPTGGEAPDRSTAPPAGGEAPDRSTAPPAGGDTDTL